MTVSHDLICNDLSICHTGQHSNHCLIKGWKCVHAGNVHDYWGLHLNDQIEEGDPFSSGIFSCQYMVLETFPSMLQCLWINRAAYVETSDCHQMPKFYIIWNDCDRRVWASCVVVLLLNQQHQNKMLNVFSRQNMPRTWICSWKYYGIISCWSNTIKDKATSSVIGGEQVEGVAQKLPPFIWLEDKMRPQYNS